MRLELVLCALTPLSLLFLLSAVSEKWLTWQSAAGTIISTAREWGYWGGRFPVIISSISMAFAAPNTWCLVHSNVDSVFLKGQYWGKLFCSWHYRWPTVDKNFLCGGTTGKLHRSFATHSAVTAQFGGWLGHWKATQCHAMWWLPPGDATVLSEMPTCFSSTI